jgi:hypothetical protein
VTGGLDTREQLEQLRADIERGAAVNRELQTVNESLGRLAGNVADATVAALSAMPFLSGSSAGLGFVGDVLEHCGAAMRECTSLQAAALGIIEANAEQAIAIDNRLHSVHADHRGV